ncbi:hypothetical protein GCM10028813_04780 [Ramlibacter alkalitolerans]
MRISAKPMIFGIAENSSAMAAASDVNMASLQWVTAVGMDGSPVADGVNYRTLSPVACAVQVGRRQSRL